MRAALLLPALALASCRGELEGAVAGAPQQVRLFARPDNSIEVAWSAVAAATSYRIYREQGADVTLQSPFVVAGGPSDVLPNLQPTSDYAVMVTAIVGARETAPSPIVRTRTLGSSELIEPPHLTITTSGAGALFGSALAAADVDADGFDDLVIGAPGSGNGGSVSLHLGSPGGFALAWMVSGSTGADMGASVAAGDVDGDGFADVLAGAPGGATASLWLGSAIATGGAPDWTETHGGTTGFGVSVGLMGHGGFAVGEQTDGSESRLYGFDGTTLSQTETWSFQIPSAPLGPRVPQYSGSFDANETGDPVTGAPGDDGLNGDGGSARAWYAPFASGDAPEFTSASTQSNEHYGSALTIVDRNADGFDDVVVGAPDANGGEGRARLFFGSGSGLTNGTSLTFSGEDTERLGTSATTIPDISGDGRDEFALGAPRSDVSGDTVGRVRIYYSGGFEDWIAGTADGGEFGAAIAGGDFNGDGMGDIAVGAPEQGSGRVSIFLGRALYSPEPSAGYSIDGRTNENVSPSGAIFSDRFRSTYTCRWFWGTDPEPDVVSPCKPENVGAVTHAFTSAGRHAVRLRVEAVDGRFAEAATTAVIE